MSTAATFETGPFQLPRRVTRKLLRGRWHRKARNVLVVAGQCSALVGALNRSGVNANGIDDSSTGGDSKAGNVHVGSVAGGFPYPPQTFDLVLVGPCRAFENGVNGPESLIAIANLLSSLKPKGRLIWLDPPAAKELHLRLPRFPVNPVPSTYHDGWERFLSLEWLMGRHRHIELPLTTVTIPAEPVSRLKWHQLARDAALGQPKVARRERAA